MNPQTETEAAGKDCLACRGPGCETREARPAIIRGDDALRNLKVSD